MYLHAEDAHDQRLAEQVLQLSIAVPALVEADLEYDAALAALKELNRRVAESGWIQVEHNALREAGMRLVAAESRRAAALARLRGDS
ncbi:hypothetical protein CO641_02235 [Lysobacteraceae bacterium NML91-0213]|nr:hypothetical protein CO641_02235 [Xanthomonadaceae bacterium NML91-0213]